MSELKGVYKEVPNWRDTHKGMNRPEYVLKNGSARNCYGLLKDIHGLQEENQRLTAIATKHATRADELYEALEMCIEALERSYDATEWPADGSSQQEVTAAQCREVLDRAKINAASNSSDD